MGSCANSVQNKKGPAMELQCSTDSQGENIHIDESPVKNNSTVTGDPSPTELNSKPQSMPYQAGFQTLTLSSGEEMFFDSHPCLESDCEDYLSVNGDFLPSSGTTPIHQDSSAETSPREECLYIISEARSISEPSPTDMKKQLIELFRENTNCRDTADDKLNFGEVVEVKPITVYLPQSCTSRSPDQPVASSFYSNETSPHRGSKPGKGKPTHSAYCCFPSIVRSLSFSERKKRPSPACGGKQ